MPFRRVEPDSVVSIVRLGFGREDMTPIDPWEKAADCERSMKAAADPEQRAILQKLRDLWMTLGNEKSFMTDAEVAKEIEVIGLIHAEMLPHDRPLLH
jgi:hypothetical protein